MNFYSNVACCKRNFQRSVFISNDLQNIFTWQELHWKAWDGLPFKCPQEWVSRLTQITCLNNFHKNAFREYWWELCIAECHLLTSKCKTRMQFTRFPRSPSMPGPPRSPRGPWQKETMENSRSRWVGACNSTILLSLRFHRPVYF